LDNKSIANTFYETADLMEVRGDDPFRIRSYRRAAEAIEALPRPIIELVSEEKKLLEIPGIGKGMAANLRETATQLRAKTKGAIDFEVVMKNGRPVLKPVVKG